MNDFINDLLEDDYIKETFLKPVKRKAYPIFFGELVFNIITIIMLIVLVVKVNKLSSTVLK